jgi:SRSO17 transposase
MFELTDVGRHRLEEFLEQIGRILGNSRRRASFATYALGLLAEGDRKSVEPIAARACGKPDQVDAAHQRLLHFLADSDWSDGEVRCAAAMYALAQLTRNESVETWIIDDTGFLKQGKHSVGVQRQYTGSAGKITNCQIGVSLTVATPSDHLPVDFELYLPKCWTDDPARRREARIPDEVVFKTKPELALAMIAGAREAGIPSGVVLGDSAYGSSSDFRLGIRRLDLQYSLAVDPKTTVYEVGQAVNGGGRSIGVRDLAHKLKAKGLFHRHSWRTGTKGELAASFAMRRVFPCREESREAAEREAVWLLIEWREGEDEPANYFFSSLPENTTLEELVRITMQRWRTERAYEDLKGELGLDHYEGRRFRGWHHHISVVLCCYAFAVAERHRFFPLSTRSPPRLRGPDTGATRAALSELLHHRPHRHRSWHRKMVAKVPLLPPS